MQPPPNVIGPTAPQHAIDAGVVPPIASAPPPQRSSLPRALLAIVILGALLVGLVVGVLIGRAPSTTVTSPPASVVGQLAVSSSPADGNIVVDGRFVGVAPIARLDLDPGNHSVVVDAFGYQPYSATIAIEPRGKLHLSVTLAPVGVEAPTIGSVTGVGTAKHAVVPASALLPAGGAPPAAEPNRKPAPPRASNAAPARTPPPPPPRRDCSGEKSRCRDSCRSAESDCRFSCPGCTSCLTSVGWDECKRQCDTCRTGCDQNTKFCESSCDSQYGSCEASQP